MPLLRVATYNIHRSVGIDRRHDPERTAAVIRETGADILALQEVEDHSSDPGALARATGMNAIPGPTVAGPDSNYGNLLLTRLAVEQADSLDLSWGQREPRGLIEAWLRAPDGALVRCLATHLGLSRRERVYQHRLLSALLTREWEGPTLLMGDFNEWHPFAAAIRALDLLLGRSPPCRSFPSLLPLLPLDRIWLKPADRLLTVSAWTSSLARRASDHLPVVAEVEIDRLPSSAAGIPATTRAMADTCPSVNGVRSLGRLPVLSRTANPAPRDYDKRPIMPGLDFSPARATALQTVTEQAHSGSRVTGLT